MDLVVRCARLPVPGETITAASSNEIPGGKGANQAVAAARAGGNVTMIGRVGDDAFADRLVLNLKRERVDTRHVASTMQTASGIAVVAVEDSGENAIMVVPGSNGQVTPEDVDAATDAIRDSDVMLLQLEIPIDTVMHAVEVAAQCETRVILDPAPMPESFPRKILDVDIICPNQSEASAITGWPIRSVSDAERAAVELHDFGARNVIITLGGHGAVISDGNSTHWIEPHKITPVDTTAAGDAFAGALAVRLAVGDPLVEAAAFAAAAGAIAATRPGAQPGMPNADEITRLRRP